jgi:adenylate cyclase
LNNLIHPTGYYYKYYLKKGDYDSAGIELLTAYDKAKSISLELLETKYEKELIQLGIITNQFDDVKNYINNYFALSDSIKIREGPTKVSTYEIQMKDEKHRKEMEKLELAKKEETRNGLIGGAFLLIIAGSTYGRLRIIRKTKKQLEEKNTIIEAEKKHSDDLLLNILPAETAEELKKTGQAKAKSAKMVTVMFTDFKNFTKASETMTPEELVAEIHYCYSAFDRILSAHGVEKIKTIGDGYMAAGGLPIENTTNPVDTIKAALNIRDFMAAEHVRRSAEGKPFFDIRIGLHTGPVVAGIVGIKKFAYDIWGDTVNIASRMESSGEIGKVNISGATYELVKDKFTFAYRGKIMAKNKGEIDMYFVEA